MTKRSKSSDVQHAIIGVGSGVSDKPGSMLDPDAIAASYLQLVQQDRSAWSDDLTLRPWIEKSDRFVGAPCSEALALRQRDTALIPVEAIAAYDPFAYSIAPATKPRPA